MKTVYLVGCIKRDIIRWVQKNSNGNSKDLSEWFCGMTHVSDNAVLDGILKAKGLSDVCYRKWFANEVMAAQEIVGFFGKNGMKIKQTKGTARPDARFVYVFKNDQNIADEIVGLLG
jgi:hypothetical protein